MLKLKLDWATMVMGTALSRGENSWPVNHTHSTERLTLTHRHTHRQSEQKCNYCYLKDHPAHPERGKEKIESWTHLHSQLVSSWSGPSEGVQCTATDAFGGSNMLWCFHHHHRLKMMTGAGEVHLHVLSSGHHARVLLSLYLYLCVSSFLFTLQLLISSTGIVLFSQGGHWWRCSHIWSERERERAFSQSALHNWSAFVVVIVLLLLLIINKMSFQSETTSKWEQILQRKEREKKKEISF